MPEIKHTFQGGKMNKDLDERLVPNGEFRSAENVQVRTSKTDAIGTVQNIKSNKEIGSSYIDTTWMVNENEPIVVASVADEKSDKAYFFFASPPVPQLQNQQFNVISDTITSEMVFIDSIIEQDINGNDAAVVVDRHTVINTFSEVLTAELFESQSLNFQSNWTSFQVNDASKYRVGMTIKALGPSNFINTEGQLVDLFLNYVTEGGIITNSQIGNGAKIKHIDLETNTITLHEEQFTDLNGVEYFVFEAPPVLNFQGNTITGVNVIDNLLFWTDNLTEPKKVNIDRCKAGTVNKSTHTKLFVDHPMLSTGPGNENYVVVSDINPGLSTHPVNEDLLERHITVLRQAPRTAPTLEMKDTLRTGEIRAEFTYEFEDTDPTTDPLAENDEVILDNWTFANTDFKPGDRLDIELLQSIDPLVDEGGFTVTFVSYVDDAVGTNEILGPSNFIKIRINSRVDPIVSGNQEWQITLKQKKPLFELKLARFGYRYKYEDGEYSAFSPWSELAFMPGEFDMVVRKAYNLGMVNKIQELIVKDFIPYKRPLDVVAVDLLYKEASKPNCYIVKTINRTKDDTWEINTPSLLNPTEIKTGRLNVTSEMIHRVLPSNQMLRAFDNVPRYALAQEITANRLIYGNYTQGYPFNTPVGLKQMLVSDDSAAVENPQKSVKSIRQYKWGMVFGDKYGRETPVIESGYTDSNIEEIESMSGEIVVNKDLSHLKNHFELQQNWDSLTAPNGTPPAWADYVKYYVKETSNEYYNLVMDRWYWADEEKDNVWLSFNSADRNKVTEETYLLLKNQHGNDTPVGDKARYKIIAIENDAPDFIKTVRRRLGEVEIFPAVMNKHRLVTVGSDVYQGVQQTGWGIANMYETNIPPDMPEGLMFSTTCQLYIENWNDTISGWAAVAGTSDPIEYAVQDFSNSIFGRRIEGNIKMRIKATQGANTLYTSWRSLYHYRLVENPEDLPTLFGPGLSVGSGSGGPYEYWQQKIELNWDSIWDSEAFMYERFEMASGVGSTAGMKMYLEFVEDDIDHRPQFDGKFFVKVEKNLDLEANVLYAEGSGGVYFNRSVHSYTSFSGINANCANNSSVRYQWNGWTFLQFSALFSTLSPARAALPFIDRCQPHFAAFTDVPIGNVGTDPSQVPWATANQTFGVAGFGAGFAGGFQSMAGVNGPCRMYISRQAIDYSNSMAIDGDNDGQAEGVMVSSTLYPWYYTAGDSIVQGQEVNHAYFMSKMSQPGTMFRFSNNPQEIYEVVNAGFATGPGGSGLPRNYGGETGSNSGYPDYITATVQNGTGAGDPNCTPCGSGQTGACFRHMLRCDFRRVNIDTGQPIYNTGLGLAAPESGLGSATGSGLNRIYIVEPSDIFGSAALKQELGGCWETEPVEDVDLELYYEASNAIPMKLTEYNAFDYAPINSKVKIRRWTLDDDGNNVLSDVELTNTDHIVSNIEFLNDSPLIHITSLDYDGNRVPHIYDIQPDENGDEVYSEQIVFVHPDGTETTSNIIGEYSPTSTPVTSATGFVPTTVTYSRLVYSGQDENIYIEDATGLTPGMNISSINGEVQQLVGITTEFNDVIIPNGTTIEAIYPNETFPYSNWDNPGVRIELSGSVLDWDTSPIQDYVDNGAPQQWPYQMRVRLSNSAAYYQIDPDAWKFKIKLGWHNCYSFGNGVESDRIRDDFNASQLDNGVRVSTTFSGYGEERKSSGMIYSGLYNSTSEVNDLNEFNMGEKIQKDLNPTYGSIQALKTRDTDVVVFAEDKVLKVLANKEAVYNADGNPQLTATNRVLGQAVPFGSNYGISQNPESLAVDQFRMYFTDKQRGAVLRLSMDGITPISDVGMKTWFRENLPLSSSLLGTFDGVNGEYNLTVNYYPEMSPIVPEPENNTESSPQIENWTYSAKTVSFNEAAKGWVSFKSFIPQAGEYVGGKYITARSNKIWEHYADDVYVGDEEAGYSYFYGVRYESRFSVVFNDLPSTIKHFNTINYEGTQSFIKKNIEDNEYYNLDAYDGWYVDSFKTDLQEGYVPEFINKENKWFNKIRGVETNVNNVDTSEFTVQGLGTPVVVAGNYETPEFLFTVQLDPTNTPDVNFNINSPYSSSSTYDG